MKWLKEYLCSVAKKTTSSKVLTLLSFCSWWEVIDEVVDNPNAPSEVFYRVFNKGFIKENEIIHFCFFHSITRKCYERWRFHYVLADSIYTPSDLLEKLGRYSRKLIVQIAVARNPSTPVELLREMARWKDYRILRAIICNSKTPVDVIEYLTNDINVGNWAKEKLKELGK